MTPEDVITTIGGRTWQEALKTLRSVHGRGTARWLAGQLDVVPRTAERYLAAAGLAAGGQRRAPVGKEDLIIRLAAVAKLQTSSNAWVGVVSVVYAQSGRPEGARNIGLVQGVNLAQPAALLARGQITDAAAEFGGIILDAYGDLGGTLAISDYHDRPQLS